MSNYEQKAEVSREGLICEDNNDSSVKHVVLNAGGTTRWTRPSGTLEVAVHLRAKGEPELEGHI